MNASYPNAVQQVGPEGILRDLLLQVAMRGTDNADVHLSRLGFSQTGDFFFLEHPEQARLHRSRHVSDFIQEDRSSLSGFKKPPVVAVGPGKGAFLVPE